MFNKETGTIKEYKGQKIIIQIPKKIDGITVKHIGPRAFHGKNIEQLIMPSTIITIGYRAFADNNIQQLRFKGEKIKEIGWSSFRDNNITELSLPNSIKKIRSEAFENNLIKKLRLGSELRLLGNDAFSKNNIKIITNDSKNIKKNNWGSTLFGTPPFSCQKNSKTFSYELYKKGHSKWIFKNNTWEKIS